MLHKVNPPDAACQEIFRKILEFQRSVLAYACSPTTNLPLEESALVSSLGVAGNWFWSQLHVQRGESKGAPNASYKALTALIQHVKSNSRIAQAILDAFDHDICFTLNINDATFQFQCPGAFDDATKRVLKPLMLAFYEDFLRSGYPVEIHGVNERFDRDALVRRFWNANPDLNVCPACDGQRPDSIDDKNYSDADHYLPKSIYLMLSVHPGNLVPICGDCNSSFKGTRDPIALEKDAPLVNIFVPYLRPALDYISVESSRASTGQLQFCILDADGSRSRRVESLVSTFRLEERWSSRETTVVGSIREAVANARRLIERMEQSHLEVNVQDALRDMAKDKRKWIGKSHNSLLQASYLNFASEDKQECAEWVRQYLGS